MALANPALRPNQIFAVSLPHSPLTKEQQQSVVLACELSLLTSYGLRSLDRHHPQYQGHYGGDQYDRDSAYHQGTGLGLAYWRFCPGSSKSVWRVASAPSAF